MTHYIDMTNVRECMSILPDPGETVVLTGVSIYSMPLSVKRKEEKLYADFAQKYGIYFIFDDEKPEIDFYCVPRIEIGATDGAGGFIASVNGPFSLRESAPLVYISPDRQCFLITEDSSKLLSIVDHWRTILTPWDGFRIFASKDQAREEFRIVDLEKTAAYQSHLAAFPPKPTV